MGSLGGAHLLQLPILDTGATRSTSMTLNFLSCISNYFSLPIQIPNGPQCKPPSVPMPLPKPPVEENTASAVQTSCSPVDKFVRCLCNTGTIGYACQYQDLMMQGCRTLTKVQNGSCCGIEVQKVSPFVSVEALC